MAIPNTNVELRTLAIETARGMMSRLMILRHSLTEQLRPVAVILHCIGTPTKLICLAYDSVLLDVQYVIILVDGLEIDCDYGRKGFT